MKYYKDANSNVYAYEADGSQDKYIPSNLIPITQAEADALRNPFKTLADSQAAAIRNIDADVDGIYLSVMGQRSSEYELAESDANAYKTAGYPVSPVPASVQAWATAKAQTPKWAADDIILTASNWRNAQSNIRVKRLAKKEAIRTATTQAAIDTAMADWASFVTTTKTSLGI